MKVLLGSLNPSKKRAVEIALKKLNFVDYEIECFDAPSKTHGLPIGYEIIRGAENRNAWLREQATNRIEYDYICSIEGGFSLDENGVPFVVTYCIVEDKDGKSSIGKSLGIELSKEMFEFVKKGKSLNKVIDKILNCENNKQKLGIMGYLTDGLYDRESADSEAVVSGFIPFIYKKQIQTLEEFIKLESV